MDINRKLIDIALDLHGKGRSGILRIQKNSAKKQLVLRNGMLAFAESNLPQEHLARIMVDMNLVPRAGLTEIASLMKAGKTSEEAILALSGPDMNGLEKGRREQAILVFSSVLGWNECEIHFYPGDNLVRHQLNLGLEMPAVITESLRYALSKRLLKIPPQFFEKRLAAAADFSSTVSLFPLTKIELYACTLLDRPTYAADVLPLIPTEEANAADTLLFLFFMGIITAVGEAGAEETTEPEAERPDAVDRMLDEMLHRFESASLYDVLSVPANASQEEIQNAYHLHAKRLHPDRFQSAEFTSAIRGKAEKVFASINEAYLTLKNPDSRALYEEKQKEARSGSETPEQMAEALFREGRSLLASGELDAAVERLKGCVWLCPQKAAYHYHLGIAESEIPKLRKDAEQHLLRAIEIEDVSAECHLALAKLYMKVRLPRKAELQLHKALLWDRDNAEALRLSAELKKLS